MNSPASPLPERPATSHLSGAASPPGADVPTDAHDPTRAPSTTNPTSPTEPGELLFSIVLPVYNQADHIEEVVEAYTRALDTLPDRYEMLLVINGPRRDNSLEICRRLEDGHPAVRTLVTDKGGWGWAVRWGLSQAQGRILCYTNSARTRAEELILHLLYARTFPDVVVKANRKIREGAFRRLGSLFYNILCRALFDIPYWDMNGTPKVFPRHFAPLLALTRDDDLVDLEFNRVCRREEYQVLEVTSFSFCRKGGESTTNLRSAYRMYAGALGMWWRTRRR